VGSTCMGHDLLEFLLVVVPKAVLLLVIALVVVIPLGVVELLGEGVELLPLGAVGDEVCGVATLEAAPKRSPPLLVELVQGVELSPAGRSRGMGHSHTTHQKLQTKRTKQTPNQMRLWCWWG
jgi:hypothetical protein